METIFETTQKLIDEVTIKTTRTKVGNVIEIKGTILKIEPTGTRALNCKDCFFYHYDWMCPMVKCLYSERRDDTSVCFREVKNTLLSNATKKGGANGTRL